MSRGLLHRTVAADGRSSLFDPAELDALKLGRANRREGELHTVIATAITKVDDQALLVRGVPLVDLVVDGATFSDLVDHLWATPADEPWPVADPGLVTPVAGLEGLRCLVAAASAGDSLRHDRSPRSVRAAGRRMITVMAHGLPVQSSRPSRPSNSSRSSNPSRRAAAKESLSGAVWRRQATRRGTAGQRRALDVAMALLVDHGLASSTFAARIAASVRADPYSVVSAGLGVFGGSLHGAASAAVHQLLADAAARGDAAAAVGDVLRDTGRLPGFGHTIYTVQDPRYAALMAAVVEGWADDPRLTHVYRVRDVVAERRAVIPNVDLALGSLTWLAGMDHSAGETIFAISRSAGWVAHAIEEYGETALRFRPRARYLGEG